MADVAKAGRERIAQSLAEEIVNAITHGVGAALSAAGIALLVVFAADTRDTGDMVAVTVYGSTLFLLFLFSTLYHALPEGGPKEAFRLLDHCAIYLAIAGTYTPFAAILLPAPTGTVVTSTVWALAATGIAYNVAVHMLGLADRCNKLSVAFYLLLGWVGVFWIGDLAEAATARALWFIVIGGVTYSAGVIFYLWERMPFNHAVWHLFVLAASIVHFLGVLLFVLPEAAPGLT